MISHISLRIKSAWIASRDYLGGLNFVGPAVVIVQWLAV